MSSTNFNDNADTHFLFQIGGHEYKLRYPTLDELTGMRKRIKASIESNETSKAEKVSAKEINDLIEKVNQTSPSISEVLKSQPTNVVKRFNNKIAEELDIV